MPATRRSAHAADVAPEQRRDEIIAILATGLVRLVGGSTPPASPGADVSASMLAEKLSESGEIGLELSGKTRLSVLAS